MTVEAALALPLFLFFSAALMQPILWLDRQRQVQTMMESVGEELSQYGYVVLGGDGERLDEERSEYGSGQMKNLYEMLSGTAAGLWMKRRVETCAKDAVVMRSKAVIEQENILFDVQYREMVPFFLQGNSGVIMSAAVKRRMWVGMEGKLRESGESCRSGENDDSAEWVYVGASMGRYHLYRDCHYISNQYEAISIDQAIRMKNSYGTKLTACSRCGKNNEYNGTVYITNEGEHYHYSKSCSAMAAYVRQVQKKEVEYLGVCSYCMRRKGTGE